MSAPVQSHPVPPWSVDFLKVALLTQRTMLPSPVSVSVDGAYRPEATVRVSVAIDDFDAWATALGIVGRVREPRAVGTVNARVETRGRRGLIELVAAELVEAVA